MAKAKAPQPFDITMSDAARATLADDLCRQVEDALSARAPMIGDGGLIDLFDWFYEQGRSQPKDRPFPGAADLTSYFITENVDALRSRLMKAVFGVRPFCFVEGWGPDAAKAPYVEAFHDWQVRKSGLREELARTIHGALIEDGYILEVSEKVETRRVTQQLDAALHLENGAPVFEHGQPRLRLDEYGDPVPPQQGEPSARIERTQTKTKRLGPQYDPISLKDFVFLPGHVKHLRQIRGYAYRLWKWIPDLEEAVKDGIYDEMAVKHLGESSDRTLSTTPTPVGDVQPQELPNVEKELFQCSIKRDFDGDGRDEWYVATISIQHRQLLRLKLDTFVMQTGKPRCVPFILFPRRDSVYGYSYAEKLSTLAEEHTALRNMKADRGALATNAPIKRRRGALWDPDTQPIGVGRVIDVNEHDELMEMQFKDVPPSIVQSEAILHQAKERVGGLSDAFVGLLSTEQRTLGENRLAAGGSAVRVDEVVGHLHTAIAAVMELSHAIWIETLKSDPRGMQAPAKLVSSLKANGLDLQNGRFTVEQLQGDFAFEPYGSDTTANPDHELTSFNNGFMALANLAKVFPALQALFQNPAVAKTILQEWARVYDIRDKQPFMDAFNAPPPPPVASPGPAMPMGAGPHPGAPPLPPGIPPPVSGGQPSLAALLAAVTAGAPPNGGPPPGAAGV